MKTTISNSAALCSAPRPPATVIFHGNCPDGFGAALSAWLKLKDTAEYLPFTYDMPAPDVKGQDVYIVDFCFNAEQMKALSEQAKSLTLLDHHVTSERALSQFKPACCGKIHFDLTRSGARLAWEHFHPGTPVPMLIQHIEDRDLWKWHLPDTAAYLMWVDTLPRSFEAWEAALLQSRESYLSSVTQGRAMLVKFESLVASIAERATPFDINGTACLAVNCPPEFTSEVGSFLAKKTGGVALLWSMRKDKIRCSLRSAPGVDIEPIARAFGGGGHPQAAAFSCNPGKLLQIAQGTLYP